MDEKAASPGNSAAPPAAPEPHPAPPPAPPSIGERLRAGRERSGLSIAAAGEKLHLDPKIIEALEADRFAEVGASVYVRGHLKRYADFVGEPGAELVAMYGKREVRVTPPDLTQVPHAERRADPRRLVTPLAVLGACALLLVAVWWVLAGSQAPEEASPTIASGAKSTGEAMVLDTPPSAATPAALSSTSSPELPPTAADAGARTVAMPAEAGSTTAVPTASVPPRETAREIRLRLELSSDSWVEVYDSRGDRLFYDVASAGSVQAVSGRGPLRVVLGNAAGVSVEVDGQAWEIPTNAANGEGASFVVNRSGSLSRAR